MELAGKTTGVQTSILQSRQELKRKRSLLHPLQCPLPKFSSSWYHQSGTGVLISTRKSLRVHIWISRSYKCPEVQHLALYDSNMDGWGFELRQFSWTLDRKVQTGMQRPTSAVELLQIIEPRCVLQLCMFWKGRCDPTASCERSVSTLQLMKTCFRSTMNDDWLHNSELSRGGLWLLTLLLISLPEITQNTEYSYCNVEWDSKTWHTYGRFPWCNVVNTYKLNRRREHWLVDSWFKLKILNADWIAMKLG